MEELKNLVGREVKVRAYIGKEKERLSVIYGIIKSVSTRGITIESRKYDSVLSIPINKIMIIWSYETDLWKRVWTSDQRKVLWGNPKVFKRREKEINKWDYARSYIEGACFALFMVVLIGASIRFLNVTHNSLNSLNLNSGVNIFNQTHLTNQSSATINPLNPLTTNNTFLTSNGWQYVASIWYTSANVFAYVLIVLSAYFLLLWSPLNVILSNPSFDYQLNSYMKQKFEDEANK